MGYSRLFAVLALVALVFGRCIGHSWSQSNYAEALQKSILFFEGQRSGKLPSTQRMKWRADSGLQDGKLIGVDLVGGYYDAGDNIKFGFPMAFTATVLSWSVIEFGEVMGHEAAHARTAIRWTTDYLLKATNEPNKVYVQVGQPYADHNCWERPEDMDTPRDVYFVDAAHPGSEVAAETAAALAAASIVFKSVDPSYSNQLLERAKSVFEFADKYRGEYNDSLRYYVCPFYCDYSGYMDELVWGAAWLHKATGDSNYWQYAVGNIHSIAGKNDGEFGWDDKRAGIYVLMSKTLLRSRASDTAGIVQKADSFVCSVLPESPTKGVKYSPGGLLFKPEGSNMQNAAALSFLLVVYSEYMNGLNRNIRCGQVSAPQDRLVELARSQADYILGKNPMGMSYMVGYGPKFPQRIHHRASSLPSMKAHPQHMKCKDGTPYFQSQNPNLNLLVGAVVGGPTNYTDEYPDRRDLFVTSEPTTYINAPLVGLFAYLNSHK